MGLCRWVIDWDHPGPAVPVCGAYAIRPYASGRLFSSVRVGAYCIRPTRRSRQGDECGCPVISQGDLLGASGPCRARFGGVCCCALPIWMNTIDRQGRGATAYAPSDVPDKGTNAGARLFRRVICLGRPGPTVPVCGAYAIAPYVSGFCFLTVRVGAYCIRPIRRPR